MIPAEAVEAAGQALRDAFDWGVTDFDKQARAALKAAAPHMLAEALLEAADEFAARLPDGTGNGRAYNSHQVARILRECADTIKSTK